MDITFDWYLAFYYVASYKSVSLAAEKLFISQPAVSQTIKQLESALGCKLFTRTARGVRLTAEGETLFYYIKPGVEQIRLGEKKLRELLDLERGELRIGASDMTLEFYLLPHLEAFHRDYPAIQIRVTNGPTPVTIRDMHEGKIDFGVVTEPFTLRPGFASQPVGQIEDIFICSPSRKSLCDRPLTPSELSNLPLICLEPNTSTRRHIDTFFSGHGLTLHPEFELATSDLIVEFVKRDLGVGCVMADFAREALARGEVCEVSSAIPMAKRNICLLRSTQAPLSRAAEVLIQRLSSAAEGTNV